MRIDSITSVTPTICKLMGITLPAHSIKEPLAPVIEAAQVELGPGTVDKCLIYAPDAVGAVLYRDYPQSFCKVMRHAPIRVALQAVVPPLTPACFASMFTGTPPAVHGIRKYEKPVLTCDTVFDALVRCKKKVAIVAVSDSSIDRIFRKRRISYFSERYDGEVTARTLSLLEADEHDLVLVYHQEYDDVMHRTTPQSPEALCALATHLKSFECLALAFSELCQEHNRLTVFAPDHGAHMYPETRKGDHKKTVPEVMQVHHFFGVGRAVRK